MLVIIIITAIIITLLAINSFISLVEEKEEKALRVLGVNFWSSIAIALLLLAISLLSETVWVFKYPITVVLVFIAAVPAILMIITLVIVSTKLVELSIKNGPIALAIGAVIWAIVAYPVLLYGVWFALCVLCGYWKKHGFGISIFLSAIGSSLILGAIFGVAIGFPLGIVVVITVLIVKDAIEWVAVN